MRVQITVPANTLQSAPQVTTVQFNGTQMSSEIVRIPRGHAYLTGLQIRAGSQNEVVIPEPGSNTQWLIGDGDTIEKHVPVSYNLPNFQVQITAYNLDDTYPHTFLIDME